MMAEWDIVYVEKDYLLAVKNAEREGKPFTKVSIVKYDAIDVQIFDSGREERYYVVDVVNGERSYHFETDMLVLSFKLKINALKELF